jgi:hypothetical protein
VYDLSADGHEHNLDGGRKPNENADVVAHLTTGRTQPFPDVNRSAEWPTNTTPTQPTDLLTMGTLPPSTVAGELSSIDIVTNFPGGLSGKNWDITSVTISVSLGCARTTARPTLQDVTLLNLNPGNPLSDGSTGLCRETGSVHGCGNGGSPPLTIPPVPPSQASDIVTSFQMTITTGQDDLRCCDSPGNNANVVIGSTNVSTPTLTFGNVNDSLHFDNGVTFSFPLFSGLPDPASATALTLGQLKTLDIQTNFGGFQPDNWDIQSVVLSATVAVGGCCGPVLAGPAHGAAGGTVTLTTSPSRTVESAIPTTPAVVPFVSTPVPHWVLKASPNQGSVDNGLNGVACALPTSCVAVGGYGSEGTTTAVIEMWNGAKWSIASTPTLGSPFSTLNGVSCSGPSFCLAVGFVAAGGSEGGTFQPLAEAWNGTAWSVVSPPATPHNSGFRAVSCKAVNRCVAVGHADQLNTAQTLVETWSGGAWSVVPTPNQPGDNALEGVSCWSTTKCMAVGVSGQGGLEQTLTLEANGTPWTIVASPNQGASDNVLYSVACTSATNCDAVGAFALTTAISAPRTRQTLVELWNGSTWTIGSSPNPGAGGDVLAGIACTSTTSCVAGGSQSDGSVKRTLVQTWNGSAWSNATTPNPSATSNVLLAVACSTSTSCDAVGAYQNTTGVEQTLALQGAKAVLSKVTFNGVPGAPNLTLAGTGFGSIAPASTPAGCANTGSDYTKHAFYVLDLSGGWEAGVTGDCIGLVVGTYANKQITTAFGSGYNQPPTSHTLNIGDMFVITVLGSTCAGSVAAGTVVCK